MPKTNFVPTPVSSALYKEQIALWDPLAVLSPITATDCYKTGHIFQYPANTSMVYSNWTPRGLKHAQHIFTDKSDQKIVFFGLQAWVKWFMISYFNSGFFAVKKERAVARYKKRMDRTFGKDAVPVEHIAALHDLGYLPIEIRAVPEGARTNPRVPQVTFKNTIPEFYWVTNYIETIFSDEEWKPSTVATIAYEYRRVMTKYAELTGSPMIAVNWQGHDFAMRGESGLFDTANSSSGHACSFWGTDALPVLDWLDGYYHGEDAMVLGGSVPATEHSVMCAGGMENEIETFRRLIATYPSGILSIVSDTWDYWNIITNTLVELKDLIMARTPDEFGNAKIVVRPDSGDPVKIITGYMPGEFYQEDGKYYDSETKKELPLHVLEGSIISLWKVFGGTVNEKGFKVLDPHIGLIYGDSITVQSAELILERLMQKGYASCNVVFGIGSFSYQYNTRDTFGYAIKATACTVDDEFHELYKDPKTDDGLKKSAKGYLRVELEDGEYVLHEQQTAEQEQQGALELVFKDGVLYRDESITDIRRRLWGDILG